MKIDALGFLEFQPPFQERHILSEIISFEVAKRYFDSLGLKKLPSIQSLKQEYAALLAEKKKLCPEQKRAKAEMMDLLTVKHSAAGLLGLTEKDAQHEQQQEDR